MTKERFTQILLEENYNPKVIESLWKHRPTDVDEYDDARVRDLATFGRDMHDTMLEMLEMHEVMLEHV